MTRAIRKYREKIELCASRWDEEGDLITFVAQNKTKALFIQTKLSKS